MQDQPRLRTSGIDAAARRFVAERYGSRATDLRALGAGEWSRAYAMVLDGRPVVIRFGDHVEDFRKDRMMAAHSRGGLPIPAVTEIGATDDGYFAVSEQATGEVLDRLDEDGMRAVLPGLLAALDAIREIDVTGSHGYGIWAPDRTGPAASWAQALLAINQETTRVPGWRAVLRDFPPSAQCFDRAYALLCDLADGLPETRHIIHGDLLNRNVLVQGSRITAVIDWGNAWYGDWLYDAAWLIYWWPWFPRWQAIDIGAELAAHWERHRGLPPDLDHRLHSYLLHIGLDAMAYNAFRGRWDDLARVTAQVARLMFS
ncbi:MAG TPA: aminoglycoside phosphotransferase family protein [Streptosporangiaceae bacterium]